MGFQSQLYLEYWELFQDILLSYDRKTVAQVLRGAALLGMILIRNCLLPSPHEILISLALPRTTMMVFFQPIAEVLDIVYWCGFWGQVRAPEAYS
jgi:hypothetical protein